MIASMNRRQKAIVALFACAGLACLSIYYSIDGMSAATTESMIAGWIAGVLAVVAIAIGVKFRLWK
jgi:hypothetical protein